MGQANKTTKCDAKSVRDFLRGVIEGIDGDEEEFTDCIVILRKNGGSALTLQTWASSEKMIQLEAEVSELLLKRMGT